MSEFSLKDLEAIIAERATVTDGTSWTAKLVAGGIEKAAKKLGEESFETVIAALSESDVSLTSEAADLLYHLMVVLHMRGVSIHDVLCTLENRTAQSGLAEKANRGESPS
ncbi:MAG: phosphoribosyl-ATP diphosphatase [Ahrensia sp.]|nr:phosphoribosyl-ATP diphosphatase [Ahrensia sp.]